MRTKIIVPTKIMISAAVPFLSKGENFFISVSEATFVFFEGQRTIFEADNVRYFACGVLSVIIAYYDTQVQSSFPVPNVLVNSNSCPKHEYLKH